MLFLRYFFTYAYESKHFLYYETHVKGQFLKKKFLLEMQTFWSRQSNKELFSKKTGVKFFMIMHFLQMIQKHLYTTFLPNIEDQ